MQVALEKMKSPEGSERAAFHIYLFVRFRFDVIGGEQERERLARVYPIHVCTRENSVCYGRAARGNLLSAAREACKRERVRGSGTLRARE